jgi:hypothetical protein
MQRTPAGLRYSGSCHASSNAGRGPWDVRGPPSTEDVISGSASRTPSVSTAFETRAIVSTDSGVPANPGTRTVTKSTQALIWAQAGVERPEAAARLCLYWDAKR